MKEFQFVRIVETVKVFGYWLSTSDPTKQLTEKLVKDMNDREYTTFDPYIHIMDAANFEPFNSVNHFGNANPNAIVGIYSNVSKVYASITSHSLHI